MPDKTTIVGDWFENKLEKADYNFETTELEPENDDKTGQKEL